MLFLRYVTGAMAEYIRIWDGILSSDMDSFHEPCGFEDFV